MKQIKTLFIVGPTASGKTSLSIELAKIYGGEIVSADSMQIYRGMDVGTAKPTKDEMLAVKHHMIDVCDVSETFSVSRYQAMAKDCIRDIAARGKLPIVVGGTGLYVDALLYDVKFSDHDDVTDLRRGLNALLEEHGAAYMYDKLASVDKAAAAAVHPNDTKRVLRALERYELTGMTKAENDAASVNGERLCDPFVIGLTFDDREILYGRINDRVDELIEKGLVDEVKRLLENGFEQSVTARQAIGYKEIYSYVKGTSTLAEATELLKMSTRRYAKRQLTWFRKTEEVHWIKVDTDAHCEKDLLVERATALADGFLRS